MRVSNLLDRGKYQATVRCAVYTRKSTEEGLQGEFNTLDAQREAAEAYAKSQAAEGWACLPERYDDGGFTGSNLDRPALQRLLVDIRAGKVDTVLCYKVDRLSRSLLDFAKMMEVFEAHRVSFVSVTQQFNSATSMGRLVLNVLLSFAQFEREIISERTRDKVAATRRKGKWAGGTPLLGYDIDRRAVKLVVNEEEASQVRAIFRLYLEHQGLLPVAQVLNRRGWTTKPWVTRAGGRCGGRPFDRTNLHRLLTNVVYVGKVRYQDEVHPGEQPALVDDDTWTKVQEVLRDHGPGGSATRPGTRGFLLRGLLRCAPCGCAMTPAPTSRGTRRYRFYTCVQAQKRGWDRCPSKSIPAGQMEAFVLEQIQGLARDPWSFTQGRSLPDGVAVAGTDRVAAASAALASLNPASPGWTPEGQRRGVDLLVERVDYDGAKKTAVITFQPAGLQALAEAWAAQAKEQRP
jgi:site-specific DNA recombinase